MELLTLKDAAAQAGCSTKTLRNKIKAGELRALMKDGKHGPTYFVPETELLRMIHNQPAGGRTAAPAPVTVEPTFTGVGDGEQGSSTPAAAPSTVPAPAAPAVSSDLIMRLTDRLEEQAQELGRYKAITERAESLETRERQLQTERDRLARELAEAQAELTIMRREQLREGRTWFGMKKRAKTTATADQPVAS